MNRISSLVACIGALLLLAASPVGAQILSIGAGQSHGLALASNSRVWAWGRNINGQVGDGTTVNQVSPVYTTNLNNVVKVIGGQGASYALLANGTVMSWGSDLGGSLGNGTAGASIIPTPVQVLTNVTQLAAGTQHVLALRTDGTVWSWGGNGLGQLGRGAAPSVTNVPVQIGGLTNIVHIAAGFNHSFAITNLGALLAWGANNNGQLGLGTTTNVSVPTTVAGVPFPIACAAGNDHSLFLRANGVVMAAGLNSFGQLGNGTFVSSSTPGVTSVTNAVSISAGSQWSLARLSTGSVVTWGNNTGGRLGNNMTGGSFSTPQTAATFGTVIDARCGADFGMALLADGRVLTWGDDFFGQRGNGTLPGGGSPGVIDPLELYAGSNEDLIVASAIGTALNSTGAGNDFKNITAGQFLRVTLDSPSGDFETAPYIIAARVGPTGLPSSGIPGFPEVHLSTTDAVILAPTSTFAPFNPVLGPAGVTIGFAIPPGFSGSSAVIQGFAITSLSNNGFFASASAHEIRVL